MVRPFAPLLQEAVRLRFLTVSAGEALISIVSGLCAVPSATLTSKRPSAMLRPAICFELFAALVGLRIGAFKAIAESEGVAIATGTSFRVAAPLVVAGLAGAAREAMPFCLQG
ncbi:interleukin-6 [Corchorus olitorius]|uniref:Interleukin-6 n=1 Tax=Corchorus olitorius TaxID=93759 RepID=A0A1R3JME0_9ROSI|nr:interleukin-6 [Corchorus olitorius]